MRVSSSEGGRWRAHSSFQGALGACANRAKQRMNRADVTPSSGVRWSIPRRINSNRHVVAAAQESFKARGAGGGDDAALEGERVTPQKRASSCEESARISADICSDASTTQGRSPGNRGRA